MDIALIGLVAAATNKIMKKKVIQDVKDPPLEKPSEKTNLDGSTGHNNMNPMYSGSEPPGRYYDDNRLNTLTGSDSLIKPSKTCKNPDSVVPMTKNLAYINGTPCNDMKPFYKASDKMNNVLPFEQKRVGPGMNTDKISKGGFHPYFRILPQNVGEYKKNNLPQRYVPGKVLVTNNNNSRSNDIQMKETRDNFYKYEDRPNINGKMYLESGPAPSQIITNTSKQSYEGRLGIAYGLNKPTDNVSSTRTKDRSETFLPGNPQNTVSNPRTERKYLMNENDRSVEGVMNNESSLLKGHQTSMCSTQNVTLRGNTNMYVSNLKQGSDGTYTLSEITQTTNRELSDSDYVGNSYGVFKGSGTTEYEANATQREDSKEYFGTMSHYSGAPQAKPRVEQYYKREEVLENTTPGPQNVNKMRDPSDFVSSYEYKNDVTHSRSEGPSFRNTHTTVDQLGKIEHVEKRPISHQRVCLPVEHNNPLTVSPLHKIN